MAKTIGYWFIEKSLAKNYVPTSYGLRGYGLLILVAIHLIWACYPFIIAVKNYQTNISHLLFQLEFIAMGAVTMFDSIQLLRDRRDLFIVIDLLSAFKRFGFPERLKFLEESVKTIVNIIHYGSCFLGYIVAYYTMLENDCTNVMKTKICFILEYFIPYEAKQYEITLIILFQIYTIAVISNASLSSLVLYGYSLELLTLRIEHLKDMIHNTHLTKNKQRNFKMLRPIVLYHQEIFRLFTHVRSFYGKFLGPTKTCILLCLTTSIIEFILKKKLISCCLFIANFLALFLLHTVGQRFTTSAGSVADAIYNLNWFDSDVSTRKDVVILLCMSQHPLTIEIPLFGQLSHTSLAKEYKAVYAFYNWLVTVVKRKIV